MTWVGAGPSTAPRDWVETWEACRRHHPLAPGWDVGGRGWRNEWASPTARGGSLGVCGPVQFGVWVQPVSGEV